MSLRDVLRGCLSGDSAVRQQAEAALEQAKSADGALLALTRELCEADDEYVRNIAGLQLRRWAASLWAKQPADQKQQVREALQDRLKNGVLAVRALCVPNGAAVAWAAVRP